MRRASPIALKENLFYFAYNLLFISPIDFAIFSMGHNFFEVDNLCLIVNSGNETILISFDIEDCVPINLIYGRGVRFSDGNCSGGIDQGVEEKARYC
jgi:hypothetical protein